MKYIVIYSMHSAVQKSLRALEVGRKNQGQPARPEMFAYKSHGPMRVLRYNQLNLAYTARLLKKYPYDVMVFVGENIWLSELPLEIQELATYGGSLTQLEKKMEVGGSNPGGPVEVVVQEAVSGPRLTHKELKCLT